MARIIVIGEIDRMGEMTVECEDTTGKITIWFDGLKNAFLEDEFRTYMEYPHAMGGTYYPPVDSMLNAYDVLTERMFKEVKSLTVEGDIGTIPLEEGDDIVY